MQESNTVQSSGQSDASPKSGSITVTGYMTLGNWCSWALAASSITYLDNIAYLTGKNEWDNTCKFPTSTMPNIVDSRNNK